MHALALTPSADRTTIDRHAMDRAAGERMTGERAAGERAAGERAGRMEILAPSREDPRAAARRYSEAASRADAFRSWRDDAHRARRAPEPMMSIRFVAQYVAQQQPANAAHVENWRGARAAYASAEALDAGRGATLSVSILI